MKNLVMLLCAMVMCIVSYSQQPPCQDFTVVPDIDARWNGGEGRYEACPDSYVTLAAHGVFPNNDNGYHQSDEDITWSWSWVAEDGLHGDEGNFISIGATFPSGGYYITLQATDQNGCRYIYPEPIVLVVSFPPTFEGTTVTPEICPGEAALLEGHVQPPDLWEMEIPEQIVGQHCFVDEIGYVQTMCFEHNAFAPGQIIQSANDIESIAIDMEHSYLGDLEVWITCPSGNRLTLFDGYHGGSDWQFLGEPIDDDYDPCTPGDPYHYTWSHNATSTIEQVANNAPTYSYTDNAGNHYYGEEYIPAGDYRPTGDWSSLIGCPVNGEWCINIQDHRRLDDGVVFSVELHFADYLIPFDNLIQFQTEYDPSDMAWDGANILGGGTANTTALPNIPGQHEYVFSATDNFGCTYDTTLVVTVRDFDDPRCCITPTTQMITSSGMVCANNTMLSARALATGNTGGWSVVAYPNGDNVNNSAAFANPNSPNTRVSVNGWGTYTFRWTEHYLDFADCTDFAEVTITFLQQPTSAFTYTPILCYDGETSIAYTGNMGSDAEFTWNFDGGFVQYGATPLGPHRVSWRDSGTHGVTLSVNNNGCVSSDTLVSIYVPDKLVIDSISIVNDPCFHSNGGSAVVAHHGGTLPVSYSWSAPGSELLNLGAGNYTLSITDANGCVARTSFVVTEPAELVIQSVESTNLSCYASHDGTISVYAGGGTGELQYMWSDVGFATADRRNLPAGEYSVTVSDVNGCSQSAYASITQPERLLLQLTSDYAVCEGEPTPVYANAFGGTSPYRYFWNTGGDTFEAGNGLSTGLDVTTHYSVFARDAHDCLSETQTMTVTVSPRLSIDSVILQQIKCYGHCDGRAELVVSGGLAPLQCSWPSDNYVYDGICSGYYAVTVSDRIGCSAISTFVITQPNDFVVSTSVEPVTCNGGDDGSARVFVSGATPPYSYLWPDGTTTETLVASAGSYTITVLDDFGCRYTEEINIEEPGPIMFVPINNVTICKGQSVTLTTQVSGGTPFYDYAWSGSDGTQYYGSVCTVSPTTNSTYSLTITDSQGCSVQVPSVTVSINPDLRIASVLTNHNTICAGDEALIYVEADGGNGGPYTLMLQDGRVVASPFTVRPDTTTMYYITLTDMCGTPSVMDSILITVYPSPDELFVAESVRGCAPLSVSFSPLMRNGANYLWHFGDNDFSEDVAPVHTYQKSGDFDVTMSVTNEYGCRVERTIPNMVHVYPRPKALFDAEVQLVSAVSAEVLFTNRSVDAVRYFWFFGDSDSSMFESPRHLYTSAGEFDVTLVAENEHYCTDTTVRRIMVYNEFSFYAPTSFTPNGDGINDCFRICGSGISRNNFLMMVYDRWGELIFKTTEYDPNAHCDACSEGAWDGTDFGSKRNGDKVLPNGIYQWYCQFEDVFGIEHREQGVVNLAR